VDLTQFFTLANQNNIPYDAICQSYYPFFHGPLTDAQAAASNPNRQPVEQDVLVSATNNLGKPIFIIEAGEHYENGFDGNDPWYSAPSQTLQSQFLTDLQSVEQGLPNNLGLGIEYWDAELPCQ
jgi:arabinogalactan endo-1,4-beta-galactosidase